jgi:tRNA-dihydrouridine synthase 2
VHIDCMTLHNAMRPLLRFLEPIMTSVARTGSPSLQEALPKSIPPSSTHVAPHVPIPRNGVDYRGKVVLAPMVRSGELPSRLLALHYGADLVWGPETVDRSMIGTTRSINPRTSCIEWTRPRPITSLGPVGMQKESVIYRIDPNREKGKLVYQIGTSNPELAVQAATVVASDVSGIDVNAGCPKSFSTSGGMGAALLRTPDLLASILSALVEKVGKVYEIGISVKIRILETPELTETLVRRLCSTGITGLTVHCRTTPMRPRQRAIRDQLRMIGSVCAEHGVACLMNGDVKNRDESIRLAAEYGVDGGMIASAAESNSSAFRTAEGGGLAPWKEVVEEYLKYAMSVENKWRNTKFLLTQLIPGKEACYQPVSMSKSHVECLKILGFDSGNMMERAVEADKMLGLDEPMPSKQERKQMRKQMKRALDENGDHSDLSTIQSEKKQKQIATDTNGVEVGYEPLRQVAMA